MNKPIGSVSGCDYCGGELGPEQWVTPPGEDDAMGMTFCSRRCLDASRNTVSETLLAQCRAAAHDYSLAVDDIPKVMNRLYSESEYWRGRAEGAEAAMKAFGASLSANEEG